MFESMMFLFPRWDMLVSWRLNHPFKMALYQNQLSSTKWLTFLPRNDPRNLRFSAHGRWFKGQTPIALVIWDYWVKYIIPILEYAKISQHSTFKVSWSKLGHKSFGHPTSWWFQSISNKQMRVKLNQIFQVSRQTFQTIIEITTLYFILK